MFDDILECLALLFFLFLIGGCGYMACNHIRQKNIPGYTYCGEGMHDTVRMGQHNDFVRVLSNGDSLFLSYEISNGCGHDKEIYYTTGDKIKSVEWTEHYGKYSQQKTNVQK